MKCLKCGGEGTYGGCESCGAIKQTYAKVSSAEIARTTSEIKNDIKELFKSETLKVAKGRLDEPEMNKYIKACEFMIESSKRGQPLNGSYLVTSPNRFGKTILMKTLKYYYVSNGISPAKIMTFEEFMNKLRRLVDGRSEDDSFIKDADLFLLKVLLPNYKLKNDFSLFYTMMELYSKPSIVFLSTNEPETLLPSFDLNTKNSLTFKTPKLIRFKEEAMYTSANSSEQ